MKLKDAVDLGVGDVIRCNACECEYAKVIMKKPIFVQCGCLRLYHEGNDWSLLRDARDCIEGHMSDWGLLVCGSEIELLLKV